MRLMARDHLARHGADQLDRGLEVHRENALARRLGVVVDRKPVLHAGVVDQHVDPPERVHQPRDAGQVGEIVGQARERARLGEVARNNFV